MKRAFEVLKLEGGMLLIHLLALAAIGCAFVTSWLAWYSPEMDEIIIYYFTNGCGVLFWGACALR